MSNEVRDPETYAIIGAAMNVHGFLGLGFLEEVYRQALIVDFSRRDIPFRREASLPIDYRGQRLPCGYRVDSSASTMSWLNSRRCRR